MKRVISCHVRNRFGVLAQVAGLFSARGFNIDSLAVAPTEDQNFSRMTIVAEETNEAVLEQVRKQLSKLIDVIKVQDFTGVNHVERDLLLVKLHTPAGSRVEIMQLVQNFQGRIVDITPRDMMIELVGPEQKIDAFINVVRPFGIKEIARTGCVAMARSSPPA